MYITGYLSCLSNATTIIMNSISPECQELKVQYDACFNRWFKEKFLKGQTDDKSCADLFASYQSCVKVSTCQ